MFNMHKCESVKDIQFCPGRIDLIHILGPTPALTKLFDRLLYGSHNNNVFSVWGKEYGYHIELVPLCDHYGIDNFYLTSPK